MQVLITTLADRKSVQPNLHCVHEYVIVEHASHFPKNVYTSVSGKRCLRISEALTFNGELHAPDLSIV